MVPASNTNTRNYFLAFFKWYYNKELIFVIEYPNLLWCRSILPQRPFKGLVIWASIFQISFFWYSVAINAKSGVNRDALSKMVCTVKTTSNSLIDIDSPVNVGRRYSVISMTYASQDNAQEEKNTLIYFHLRKPWPLKIVGFLCVFLHTFFFFILTPKFVKLVFLSLTPWALFVNPRENPECQHDHHTEQLKYTSK